MILNFDLDHKINGFPERILEHFYVGFGDPNCSRFLRYHVENRQTNGGKNHIAYVTTLVPSVC